MAIGEHLIAADVAASCASPIRAGVEQVGYIINKSDIESIVEEDGIVTSIVLKKACVLTSMSPFRSLN